MSTGQCSFPYPLQVQLKIFTNPSPFDSATGDLVHEESVARCEKSLHALIEWTQRLNASK